MKVIKCEKGHFYDADSYSKCPHCNPSIGKIIEVHKFEEVSDAPVATQKEKNNVDSEFKKVSYEDENGKKTSSVFAVKDAGESNVPSISTVQEEQPKSIIDDVTDIKKELEKVSNSNPSKTVGIFGKVVKELNKAKEEKNQSFSDSPVTGWLVAIAGPHIGQSFVIVAGKNSIGRSSENDIILSADASVSSSRHAWITYESKHNNFVLQAGDGRYPDLNGEQVLNAAQLKTYDKIEIGETVLLFVNLCSDTFRWEDYL